MKYMKYFWVAILALFLVGIAACAPIGTPSQPTNDTSAQVSPVAGTSTSDLPLSATPTIDVDAMIREKLQNHHSIDRVYNAIHTRDEWNATLDRMISYGAKINEEEKKIIIDYLLARNK